METRYYVQAQVSTIPDSVEPVSNFLFELGSTGVMEQENSLVAYFPAQHESELADKISRYVHELYDLLDVDAPINITVDTLENRDWNAEWKNRWHSLRISDTILIKPSWEPNPKNPPPVVIEIDPEMAFGSGEHSTTKLTLQLVERHISPEKTMLDVGTGTGILSIAALMLGAKQAFGFDIDPIASKTALKNATANGVGERFFTFAGTIEAIHHKTFDMIAANVNRSQILGMLPLLHQRLKPGGYRLLSGILDSEEEVIRRACALQNLQIISVQKDKEWLAFETRSE